MHTKIAKNDYDIIQKYVSNLFKNTALFEFYGVKAAKVKEIINVELPKIEVSETRLDYVFLLEDTTYLHVEFQSTYNKRDLFRFARYNLALAERDNRQVNTVIIYTADVQKIEKDLNTGSIQFQPQQVMMGSYDGDSIFKALETKIQNDELLTDTDILNLIFLPLMHNQKAKNELAFETMKMARRIEDKEKQNTCLASIYAFATKYLNDVDLSHLMEVLKMSDLLKDYLQEKLQEKDMKIAENFLKNGVSPDVIAKSLGLDIKVVEELQKKLK